ncbi:GGDEF domain-containing protein [Leeia oryzae]|uniref:GGDEF domain-containing protein n=1 Tax=Leeia oryzae TaxID=356662 RepID=UPI000377EE40|nr:GGDEF domain-containing protein [Leeia oryzae]
MAAMVAVVSLAMAIALRCVSSKEHVPGFRLFSIGLLCHAIGVPVVAFRAVIPEAFSIIAGNTLVSAAFGFFLAAIYRFYLKPVNCKLVMVPVALVFVSTIVLLNQQALRFSTMSLLMLLQMLSLFMTVWVRRHDTSGNSYRLLLCGVTIGVLIFASRMIAMLAGITSPQAVWHPGLIQTWTFMSGGVFVLFTAVGIIGMYKDRSDHYIKTLAMQDELTGIGNRRAIVQELQKRFAESVRHKTPLCLLMFDLDYFKHINDCFGHFAGDEVLKTVATSVKTRLRISDFFGRYGGEEFVIILPRTSQSVGVSIAEELLARQQHQSIRTEGKEIPVNFSIGIAATDSGQFEKSEDLLKAADQALYRAKEQGRNRLSV